MAATDKRTVEDIKAESRGLEGNLAGEFADTTRANINDEGTTLIKFHGSYQQDDRDLRKDLQAQGKDKAWSFMVRTKIPGGRMTAEQYLLADELADRYGNGNLRLTTRQAIQFHGVGKQKLKPLIKALNERWVTTYGACGDVCRNVLTSPVYDLLPGAVAEFQSVAKRISDRLLPESTSYYELWLDGEKVLEDGRTVQVEPKRDEPLYGATYMPRKYKIAVAAPGLNDIDLFTHDAGLEAIAANGALIGYNLIAGGGLGSTHNKKETFPRLADRIGFLTPERVIEVMEAVTRVYRDYGDRTNRKHARLKYVLDDRGVEWFRTALGEQLGAPLAPPVPLPKPKVEDYMGWWTQADGRRFVGVWVECGRIKDTETVRMRTALREIVRRWRPEVRISAQQNIVLANIEPKYVRAIDNVLAKYGVRAAAPGGTALRRWSMACPALPTCGLAMAEAERFLPDLIGDLEQRGHGDDRVVIRMSGCPNACSRPPTAEIGIVGRSLALYNVYLGGNFEGTRLARLYKENVKAAELGELLAGVLTRWRAETNATRGFGDWAAEALVPEGRPGVPYLYA